jgi:hypothetical protein
MNSSLFRREICATRYGDVRSQVLTVARMKITAFWDIAINSLGVDRRFRGGTACIIQHPDV